MQILQPHSLYQMVWQQVRDTTQKPFERKIVHIDRAKKDWRNLHLRILKIFSMALNYTTAKGVDLTWWISWSQLTNFGFISVFVCFFFFHLFDVVLLNSLIVHKKLENKDLTLEEFKICIALKLIVFFINQKILSKSSSIQVH